MSRLATMVGALSAIVSLVDYLFARSFLSHWLQRQIRHGGDGWQISPTLNVIFIVILVALVWLATESTTSEPEARKRLFRLRANLVVGGLALWFFFGPSIGNVDVPPVPSPSGVVHTNPAAALPSGQRMPATTGGGNPQPGPAPLSHGHTSQFTWNRPAEQPPEATWKPGDGLRAMARMFEGAAGQAPTPGR